MLQLTEHFTLDELTESDTAVRLGIDNNPPQNVVNNLKRMAELSEVIRDVLGKAAGKEISITVTSGYRCEALEKVLTAKDYGKWCARHGHRQTAESWQEYFSHKAHPSGRAIDFRAHAFGNPFHIIRILTKHTDLMAQIDQIILEGVTKTSEGWVHVSWADFLRHQVMTAQFDENGVPHYSSQLT